MRNIHKSSGYLMKIPALLKFCSSANSSVSENSLCTSTTFDVARIHKLPYSLGCVFYEENQQKTFKGLTIIFYFLLGGKIGELT